MKPFRKKIRACGFTLIELLVAMTIASSIILMVLYLNNSGAKWWKSTKDTVYTTTVSRVAMQTVAQDLESFQMKPGDNNYEWLYAGKDTEGPGKASSKKNKAQKNKPSGLSHIPDSARLIFFSCSPTRNPAVSHDADIRDSYRSHLMSSGSGVAGDDSYKGDVSAICYRLEYKDNISNSKGGSGDGVFPVFSLYRQVMSAEKTYEEALCVESLENIFNNEAHNELICDNVVEMNLSFNIEYTPKGGEKQKARRLESVSVISSNGQSKKVRVRGNSVFVDGNELKNARIVSANINVSVLTEDGVVMVDRLRQDKDRKLARQLQTESGQVDFFRDYTRQFSRAVTLPQPY